MNYLDVITSRVATSLFRRSAACVVAPRSLPPPKHNLILYDFEASPWCRLVREQISILDLNVHMRPCPRQDILLQGAYTRQSRHRSEAAQELSVVDTQDEGERVSLTFPILADQTNGADSRVVIKESYAIVEHLWQEYGQDVILPSPSRRPDQLVNDSRWPFPLRFLSLSGPSYLRCLPRCGLLRLPSKGFDPNLYSLTLYQAEGCPYSRLVRELLCSLELPYHSISCATGSFAATSIETRTPVLVAEERKHDESESVHSTRLVGHEEASAFLLEQFWDSASKQPRWWDKIPPEENEGQSNELLAGAYVAFLKGQRAFVPPVAEK